MNRRSFLHPRRLGVLAGQAQQVIDILTPTQAEPFPPETTLVRYARRAMATAFEVVLPFGANHPAADAAGLAEQALDTIDGLEDQLTVYCEHSEVSQLNGRAFDEEVVVEPRLFELLQLSARLTTETGGAFDITAGALIKSWGFFRGPRRVPSEAERTAALECVGMHHVVLDSQRHSARFLRRGLEINLGSIGKGYALDRAAEVLRRTDCRSILLHGGHSSVYAMGSQPGTSRGWPVGISHPWNSERRVATVWLKNQAIGTSAATFRHLEWQGRKLGHILDPRTGWPAEGMASASVVAPTAAEADALATAFFILGVEPARAYCESHEGIGAVLLPEDASTQPIVLSLTPAECSIEAS
jgi:thiamine biosynthesis lipoprotein